MTVPSGSSLPRNTWFMSQVHVHDSRLRSYLRRQRVSPQEIPDFCQEVYLRVLKISAQPDSPQAFLIRTARNLVVDSIRHRECLRIESKPTPDATDELTPDRKLQGEESLLRFLASVQTLPRQKRKVYWLRVVEDQPICQISSQLEISKKTAESHFTAARKHVARAAFGKDEQ